MRGSAIALAAAIGGCLLAPAAPLADAPPAPPTAALTTAHTTFPAGQTITLDSSGSGAGSGAIVGHLWDLDGDGSFETDTGPKATVDTTPLHPGSMTVHVRVVDDQGLASDAKLDLNVTAPADRTIDKSSEGSDIAKQPTPAPAATPPAQDPPPPAPPAEPSQAAPAPAPTPAPTATIPPPAPSATTPPPTTARMSAAPVLLPRTTLAGTQKASAPANATVTAAAASGVTIKNFAFTPATSSVHVGDTITWSNNDVAPHTATASDGSFDTGTINKGKSASHTFTKAGTFAYICSIHPSMHGTVTVAAATSTGSSSGGTGSGSNSTTTPTPTPTPSSSGSGSNLPHTGLDIAAVVLLAMLMVGSGSLLRRRVSRP